MEECAPSLAKRGWSLAWSLMRDVQLAEDVVQQAFAVAARKLDHVPADDPWPWFGTIIAHEARNARRKRARRGSEDEGVLMAVADHDLGPSDRAERHELHRRLASELDNLPENEREALVLTYVGGLTFRSAAAVMDVAEGSFNHLVSRGMNRLRSALDVPNARAIGLLAALPTPAIPNSLLLAVKASLVPLSTPASLMSKLTTGAIMLRCVAVLFPLAVIAAAAIWANTPTSRNRLPVDDDFVARCATPAGDPVPSAPYKPDMDVMEIAGATPRPLTQPALRPVIVEESKQGDEPVFGKTGVRPAPVPASKEAPKSEPKAGSAASGVAREIPAPAADGSKVGTVRTLGALLPYDTGSYIRDFALTKDGKTIIAGGDFQLHNVELESGRLRWSINVSENPVQSLAISPDGRFIFTSGPGSNENDIRIYNLADGSFVDRFEGSGPGGKLAISPDGVFLVDADHDDLRVWNVATRKLSHVIKYPELAADEDMPGMGHFGNCEVLAISPDSVALAAYDSDAQVICLWELATGMLRRAIKLGSLHYNSSYEEVGEAESLKFSDDLKTAIFNVDVVVKEKKMSSGFIGGPSSRVIVLNIETQAIRADIGSIQGGLVAVFGDGKRIIVEQMDKATFETSLGLMDASNGKQVRSMAGSSQGEVAARVTQDGKHLVQAESNRLLVTNIQTGKQLSGGSKQLPGHSGEIAWVSFSADGKSVVSGCSNRVVLHHEVQTGRLICEVKDKSPNKISGWASAGGGLTPDGKFIVTECKSGNLNVWDARTGVQLRQLYAPNPASSTIGGYAGLRLASTANRVVASISEGVAAWDVASGKRESLVAHPWTRGRNGGGSTSFDVAADGLHAWLANDYGVFRYDLAKGTAVKIHEWSAGLLKAGRGLAVSADGSTLAVTVDVSPDKDKKVLSGSRFMLVMDATSGVMKKEIVLLQQRTVAEVRERKGNFKDGPAISKLALTPDGRYAVGGGENSERNNSVFVLDLLTGEVVLTLEGHTAELKAVAISPDGKYAVTGGADSVLRLWRIPGVG